jgi:hypothetical protein
MNDLRTDQDVALGPEWAALELLCVGRAEEEPERLAQLLRDPELQWGELLEQAMRHQTLPLLALHVLELAGRDEIQLTPLIAWHLAEYLETNRWRLAVFRREAARIAGALRPLGVPFVCTKGITFESTIYRGRGGRMLKDIDFMIPPSARETIPEALKKLGYQPGEYDLRTGAIMPHTRRMEVIYALSPDHLPSHGRLSDEPCVPFLHVDFANSLTWARSPYEVPVEEALRHRVELPLPGMAGATIPGFTPDYQFLFTVLHLFREAGFEQWLELELDVSLMKFGDVIRLFKAHGAELADGRFTALLEAYGVVEPVAWVLEHTDRTFGTSMTEQLGLEGRVDEDVLFNARPSTGKEDRKWRGTMRERLWARDRRALLTRIEAEARR